MTSAYEQLNQRLTDLHNLNMVFWTLQWDQNTMMPAAASDARAAQLATVTRVRHDMLTDDTTARLLEDAEREVDGKPFDSIEASTVRVARRDYDDAVKLPGAFVAQMTNAQASAFEVWKKAKATNDFAAFKPALQRIFDLKLQEAEYVGYPEHPYDAMMSRWEPDLTAAEVKAIFDAHKPALVEMVAAVSERQDAVDDSILHQHFPVEGQRAFGMAMAEAMGFDFAERGRLDESPHPFCLQLSRDDVRLTTRFDENFFNPAFFGTLHEAGHGMHAQGFGEDIDGTFLSDMELNSAAIDESQSRTWENLVGRSRGFWEWAFPQLQATFPDQFKDATPESVYKAVNKARPQFIRVEADELTYNLHIMLRFDLEYAWVSGDLHIDDLPDAWRATFDEFFGIVPPTDAQGVLQDIHWSMGGIGAFHGYALGNLIAAQFYATALKQHPSIPDEIASGKFDTLLAWLTENVYKHGRKFTAKEMVQRVTGESISPDAFVAHLRAKVADVYGV